MLSFYVILKANTHIYLKSKVPIIANIILKRSKKGELVLQISRLIVKPQSAGKRALGACIDKWTSGTKQSE